MGDFDCGGFRRGVSLNFSVGVSAIITLMYSSLPGLELLNVFGQIDFLNFVQEVILINYLDFRIYQIRHEPCGNSCDNVADVFLMLLQGFSPQFGERFLSLLF